MVQTLKGDDVTEYTKINTVLIFAAVAQGFAVELSCISR